MCPEMPHENALTAARATRLASGGTLAGVSRCREIHLENQCASEGILEGGASKGEFHEISQSESQVLLAGVATTREIHL